MTVYFCASPTLLDICTVERSLSLHGEQPKLSLAFPVMLFSANSSQTRQANVSPGPQTAGKVFDLASLRLWPAIQQCVVRAHVPRCSHIRWRPRSFGAQVSPQHACSCWQPRVFQSMKCQWTLKHMVLRRSLWPTFMPAKSWKYIKKKNFSAAHIDAAVYFFLFSFQSIWYKLFTILDSYTHC